MEFYSEASKILNLQIAHRANSNGGYGRNKEVIYESHPYGAPVRLTDKKANATVTALSNGSIDFRVKVDGFPEITVLNGHFDTMDKREHNVPSQNIWLEIDGQTTSLMNPVSGFSLVPAKIKIVKINELHPAMWYCATFKPEPGVLINTAVKVWFAEHQLGPILMREVFIRNKSEKEINGNLWTYFNSPSKMEHPWDRDLWYNRGMPISDRNIVIASTVPYREMIQLKNISSKISGDIQFNEATCDYISFVGHSGASAILPIAVQQGKMLNRGAGKRMNRFSTPTIAANHYALSIKPDAFSVLQQGLQYILDEEVIRTFRKTMQTDAASYLEIEHAFRNAANLLIQQTQINSSSFSAKENDKQESKVKSEFQLKLPNNPELEAFFSSTWAGVGGLYNRSYGRRIADGIEVGMRDKAQDMWPMLKNEPAIVRADLIHKFSMMYTVPNFNHELSYPLTLPEKLHGMFPRQYPSKWLDRSQKVNNDNRPYADSALWPVESLLKYINETGDHTILNEKTATSTLTDFNNPVNAKMTGASNELTILDIVNQIFDSYERQLQDSPYGMAQVLFGDWADPIEMIGTSIPGDATTRGKGKGTSVRLSEHLFLVLIKYLDFLQEKRITELLGRTMDLEKKVKHLSRSANELRKSIIRVAWEESRQKSSNGFISFIHEFKLDGTIPDYKNGETGYTIGSMNSKDFDGVNRRELLSNAYGLEMLRIERDYLDPVPDKNHKINQIIEMTDHLLSDEVLGIRLWSQPIANNDDAIKYCGRMGMIGSGCSENGEYHHAGNIMQYFRLGIPGQVNLAWKYFKPLLSIYRDEYMNGPFDSFANSYTSDPNDPHFGAGMLFGFSGSLDWALELLERIAGLELNLYRSDRPDVAVTPRLPDEFLGELEFHRTIHYFAEGKFRKIPLQIYVERGEPGKPPGIKVNGRYCEKAEIANIRDMEEIEVIFKGYQEPKNS